MAKQIIVLDQANNNTELVVQYALWLPVANPAFQRPQSNGSTWSGASAAENSAIISGAVIENVKTRSFPVGTPATAIKSTLQQDWVNENAQQVPPRQFYGVFFDPVLGGWSA